MNQTTPHDWLEVREKYRAHQHFKNGRFDVMIGIADFIIDSKLDTKFLPLFSHGTLSIFPAQVDTDSDYYIRINPLKFGLVDMELIRRFEGNDAIVDRSSAEGPAVISDLKFMLQKIDTINI